MWTFRVDNNKLYLLFTLFILLCCNSSVKGLSFDPSAAPGPLPGRTQIPVLCYHQVRDWKSTDSKYASVFIVPTDSFRAQMKMLHDNGYHSISPDQLMAYLVSGAQLPPKPFLLTFDDGTDQQYSNALPVLNQYGFKATFFIMTVTIGHPGYLNKSQIQDLAKQGHVIGCHTWNHQKVTKYTEQDWVKEIEKPNATLQNITGSPVKYFAYPFGLWNGAAVEKIKKYGFTAAFQLVTKADPQNKLYTIRRMLIDGHWKTRELLSRMEKWAQQEF